MPVIILEGIDGSGKSTLADILATRIEMSCDAHVIRAHRGPIKDSVENEYIRPLRSLSKDMVLIADRWHVGEMIYGPIYRGVSLVKPVIGQIETMLDEMNAIKVILNPPLVVVNHRLKTRGEDYLQPGDVARVHEFYRNYGKVFGYQLIDTVIEEDIEFMVDQIIEQVNA